MAITCYRCKQPYADGKCGCQDGITLVCGDCREVLPQLEAGSVELIVTDPPYGISHSTNHGASWSGSTIAGDSDTSLRDYVVKWADGKPMAIFGTPKIMHPAETRGWLIWDKGPAFGMGDLSFPWKQSFEEIYILGDGWHGSRDEAVLRGHIVVSWESKGRCHPHQKPVSLIAYILSKHDGNAVLDPFAGVGGVGRACKDLGRRCLMIELEEKYCAIAAQRLRQNCLF